MSSPAAMEVVPGSADVDVDVVVVGAGPVGLTLAAALQHHGVDVRVIEQRTELRTTSRANNLWSRPQELLAAIGVRDLLAADAYRVAAINVLLDGKPLDRVDLHNPGTPYPSALYTSQAVIEQALLDHVQARAVQVDLGRTVVSLEQDDDGVTLLVGSDPAHATDRLRCRYVVGADGGHSAVRDALGIELRTETMPARRTRQVDAKLSWRRPTDPDQLWFFTYPHGFAGVLPVSGGNHRLFFLEDDELVPDRDPTLEEMQERARDVTGDPTVTLTDPVWFSNGGFKHGVADAHGRGRVLLAGDAAHRNLPIGGQGMNAGIHDAVEAAWRLAMTLAEQAAPAVLESYLAERNAEHVRLDGDQTLGFKRLMYRGRIQDAALGGAAALVPDLGSKIFGADDLQQLSVAYPDSILSEDHVNRLPLIGRSGPRAGDRAPDATVTDDSNATTTLFDSIYNPDGHTFGWALLLFDGRQQSSRSGLAAAAEGVAAFEWVHPRLVLAHPAESEDDGGHARLFDLDGHAHAAYGLEGTPALVLTRPDGHIAFRGPADRPELLAAYCRNVAAT